VLGAARQRGVHVGHGEGHHPVLGQRLLDRGDLRAVGRHHEHAGAGDEPPPQRGDLGDRGRSAVPVDRQLLAFARREDVEDAAGGHHALPSVGLEPLHDRIVVRRVVVEEGQALHAGGERDVGRVLDRGVAPAEPVRVLLLRVLRVVDDQVGPAHEGDVPLVARVVQDAVLGLPERLVIGDVRDGGPGASHPVGDGRGGVVQVLGLDQHVADPEKALLQLGEVDPRAQVSQLDREVGVLHLPGHRLLEALLEPERRVHVELGPGQERGDEERKALDVIPMGVADEQVQAHGGGEGPDQMEPQLARAGAAVQHDDRAVLGPHLHARRVAAVSGGALARRSYRAPGAPEPYVHVTLSNVA
jgi:hypothetical protein